MEFKIGKIYKSRCGSILRVTNSRSSSFTAQIIKVGTCNDRDGRCSLHMFWGYVNNEEFQGCWSGKEYEAGYHLHLVKEIRK